MKPLGLFGQDWFHAAAAYRAELERARDVLDPDECRDIAAYLRGSTMLDPIMEHTVDLLGGRFGVPGGSTIMADFHFFWRLDAAEYVETYRVALPPAFLAIGRACSWVPERLEGDASRALYERWSKRNRQE